MKRLFVSVLFIICFSLPTAYSQDNRWVYLGEYRGESIYIDSQSIFHNNVYNYYKVYTKIITSDGRSQVILEIFYCSNRTYKILDIAMFDNNGNYVFTLPGDDEIFNVFPETNPEYVFNYLCKWFWFELLNLNIDYE